MVQREAPSTPECQEGVLSQGGQHREVHSEVHHVQVEHYQVLNGQSGIPNHEPNLVPAHVCVTVAHQWASTVSIA